MKKIIILVSSVFLIVGCKGKSDSEQTTPEKTPAETETKKETPKTVPSDKAVEVQNIWNSGLAAVTGCIEKRIAVTNQKGLNGYIIVEGTIGTSENPKNIRIVEKKLAVDKIEECIIKYLSGLVFPTWGYDVKYQHPFSVNILY